MRTTKGPSKLTTLIAMLLSLSCALSLATTHADAQVTSQDVSSSVASTKAYWTASRLVSAKPMPLPLPALSPFAAVQPSSPKVAGPSLAAPSQPPTVRATPDYGNVLFEPVDRDLGPEAHEPNMQDPSGTGSRFTSARMTPDAVAALGAESKFPFAVNGQLFFKVPKGTTVPKGDYVCSATVQRMRIITTAGHCVSDGNGHFYKGFVFVPALRNGAGPFGSWSGVYVVVSNTWHLGGGTVPNAQDVASIELADNNGIKIGQVTGTAGYAIPGIGPKQHVTTNGYPCNIDSCNKLHRNDAQAVAGSSNTVIVGSDMRGGASGGGWLLNWGEYGVGQPPAGVGEPGAILLVAVSSYGPVSTSAFYLGASILDARYVNGSNGVLDVVCAHRAGNC